MSARAVARAVRRVTTPSGQLARDRATLTGEARLGGEYLLSAADSHLSTEEFVLGYKNVLEPDAASAT